ncbi:putative secreted protein [Wickerhamomyces ciferrii]|uniref:Secreted protein n=1 Tax=Wickerhamomyces ciferrii (strain ATCC 14091 / BCRC 22168 / CBS 111 / JCM 3599 / NBRC 0793 / NRRL Y-1031 F-60-10) TaxID=1206466 RepID=K0KLE6_WICCF|nr:uncharacterized protein BN7_1738 [Wickerhamomyces ciferrii]CCH42194.1 putative secreted protein [Wickerhamomyces ciferrii]
MDVVIGATLAGTLLIACVSFLAGGRISHNGERHQTLYQRPSPQIHQASSQRPFLTSQENAKRISYQRHYSQPNEYSKLINIEARQALNYVEDGNKSEHESVKRPSQIIRPNDNSNFVNNEVNRGSNNVEDDNKAESDSVNRSNQINVPSLNREISPPKTRRRKRGIRQPLRFKRDQYTREQLDFFKKIEIEYINWFNSRKSNEKDLIGFHSSKIIKDHLMTSDRWDQWYKNSREFGLLNHLYDATYMRSYDVFNGLHLSTLGYFRPFRNPKTLPYQHSPIPMIECDYFKVNKVQEFFNPHIATFDNYPKFDFDPLFKSTFNIVEDLFSVFDGDCDQILSIAEAHGKDYTVFELTASPGLPFLRFASVKADCLDWISELSLNTYRDVHKMGAKALAPVCFGKKYILDDSNIKHDTEDQSNSSIRRERKEAKKLRKTEMETHSTNVDQEERLESNGDFYNEKYMGSWCYPAITTVFERMFTTPIYNEIVDPNNWSKSPFKLPYENYYNKLNSYGNFRYCEFEILNIHQNIPPYFLRNTFKIIHRWIFNKDIINNNHKGRKESDSSNHRLFKALEDFFINTFIVSPKGQLIRKSHGAAFGSEFTLLVISIMSTFLGVYCMLNQGVEVEPKNKNIVVLGNSVSMCVPHTFNVIQMIKDIESFGFAVDATNLHFGKDHSFETKKEEVSPTSDDLEFEDISAYYDDEL